MKYLIDTDICVYFLNKNEKVIEEFRKNKAEDLAISVITLAELLFGAYHSSQVQNNLRRVEYFAESIHIIPISPQAAKKYAEIKALLRKSGIPLADFDLLIGASAITMGATLVTNNIRHFSRLDGLDIENWS
jgi:tRNA(fMet)-specific endonuclease VapC